jgi:hypothetical protein
MPLNRFGWKNAEDTIKNSGSPSWKEKLKNYWVFYKKINQNDIDNIENIVKCCVEGCRDGEFEDGAHVYQINDPNTYYLAPMCKSDNCSRHNLEKFNLKLKLNLDYSKLLVREDILSEFIENQKL